jgi:hypothetical protein
VARRRYGKPSPAISTAGQAAHGRDPTGDESLAQPIEPKQEYGKAEPTTQPQAAQPVSGLRQQLHDMRQQQQNDALEAYISHYFPGAWPNERAALRANQVWLANPSLVHAAGRIALERGVPRESPEFLQPIGALIDQHHAAMMQAQPVPAPPPMPVMPAMPPPVTVDIERTESHEPEAEDEPMPSHYSAPVSRGDAGHSVEPQMTPSQVRLSAEQREIARLSMPHLSADEAEKTYAANLLKMGKMKNSGLTK